jgi:hypothetical protein
MVRVVAGPLPAVVSYVEPAVLVAQDSFASMVSLPFDAVGGLFAPSGRPISEGEYATVSATPPPGGRRASEEYAELTLPHVLAMRSPEVPIPELRFSQWETVGGSSDFGLHASPPGRRQSRIQVTSI